jgi:hypothetical protein
LRKVVVRRGSGLWLMEAQDGYERRIADERAKAVEEAIP